MIIYILHKIAIKKNGKGKSATFYGKKHRIIMIRIIFINSSQTNISVILMFEFKNCILYAM